MSKQTINIGASPNDGTGTPLRTSFDYTNQNFTELYNALGGGVGLPGSANQIIFNNGSSLAGDADLFWNSTLNFLTVTGSAIITADLTVDGGTLKVDSTNNFVGINKTPVVALDVSGSAAITGAATVGTTLGVTGVSTLTGAVGVGVTPSAWNSDYKPIDIGANGCIAGRVGGSNTLDIISNGFRDAAGNYVYKSAVSTPAARYLLDGSTGSHLWFSGVAGTAGNTIAGFTTAAMTLTTAGNLAFPTGKGIDFSAVTGGTGTATANVLNDYEEGTFTPTVTSVGGTGIVYVANATDSGRYTKIGRVVTFQVRLAGTYTGTFSYIRVALPFTATNSNPDGSVIGYNNDTTAIIGGRTDSGAAWFIVPNPQLSGATAMYAGFITS